MFLVITEIYLSIANFSILVSLNYFFKQATETHDLSFS